MAEKLINFDKLVDSNAESFITFKGSHENRTLEQSTKLTMTIQEEDSEIKQITSYVDYNDLCNINYDLKSALNQINEHIKNLTNI